MVTPQSLILLKQLTKYPSGQQLPKQYNIFFVIAINVEETITIKGTHENYNVIRHNMEIQK